MNIGFGGGGATASSPIFTALDYTGDVGTWTVTGPNVTTDRLLAFGGQVFQMDFYIQLTGVAGNPNFLQRKLPLGLISRFNRVEPVIIIANVGGMVLGKMELASGGNLLKFSQIGGAVWPNGAGGTATIGSITFEAQ